MLDMVLLPVAIALLAVGLVWYGMKKGKFRTHAARVKAKQIGNVI